jgi:hypothetical protein
MAGMWARTTTITLALATTLGIPAALCKPLPGYVQIAQTQHFTFYAFPKSGLKVEAEKSERFLARIEELLGHRVEGRCPYYRHELAEDVAIYSGTYAPGATDLRTGVIHSTQPFHPHEIVHRVAGELGDPGIFFHEGLAVALGDGGKLGREDVGKLARRILETAPFEDFLEPALWRDDKRRQPAYAVAGAFMQYLLETHGIDKVARFFKASRFAQSARAAFHYTFGCTLESASTSWLLSMDPEHPQLRSRQLGQQLADRRPAAEAVGGHASAPDLKHLDRRQTAGGPGRR